MSAYFVRSVALRHLRHGLRQSLLTVGVVAISVLLIVFVGTIIYGLQQRLLGNTTSAIPHVTLSPQERTPIAPWQLPQPDGRLYVGETVRLPRQQLKIEDWRQYESLLAGFDPRVRGVSPVAEGQVFLFRGARRQSVRLVGAVPERHNRIVDLEDALLGGRWLGLNAGELALGRRLAEDYGLRLGDKVRLVSAEEVAGSYTVAGIFETGFGALDSGTVFLPLRDAQSLLGLGTAITYFGVALTDVYAAEPIARGLDALVPLRVEPWTANNANLLQNLRTQNLTVVIILVMSTISAGFGIAAILVMSVTGKLRSIGILKAMGARPREVQLVFMLEGVLLAAIGSLLGMLLGLGLLRLLGTLQAPGPGGRLQPVFVTDIVPGLFALAGAVALVIGALAAWYPARQAARVDPMQVIRST